MTAQQETTTPFDFDGYRRNCLGHVRRLLDIDVEHVIDQLEKGVNPFDESNTAPVSEIVEGLSIFVAGMEEAIRDRKLRERLADGRMDLDEFLRLAHLDDDAKLAVAALFQPKSA